MSSTQPRRLVRWWTDDPAQPGRASLGNPDVQRLVTQIAPGCHVVDLGGTMSLNVGIEREGLVLRIHQPFVSRQRLLALQALRLELARRGLTVPVPMERGGSAVFRCGDRWAELESYIPHEQPTATPASYAWLFGAMGRLHRVLAAADLKVPRPLVATYAPPGSLRRWLRITEPTVRHDATSRGSVRLVRRLVNRLQERWVPATLLPRALVHGDMRLGNVCRGPDADTVYLDFGFLALRPRVHELAYSLAFMMLALHGPGDPARFAWESVRSRVEDYESTVSSTLSSPERAALAPYTAAVPLYFVALAGLAGDPVGQLHAHLPFLSLSEWLLAHPEAMLGL